MLEILRMTKRILYLNRKGEKGKFTYPYLI